MKIREFAEQDNTQLPFDVAEDVVVFMRNDPVFYRRSYYPALMQLKDACGKKQKIDAGKIFGPAVDSAMNTYCKKFKVGKNAAKVFDMQDRQNIINKIYTEEMANIQQGKY